ncbi:MAG TPA: hydrogenase expression/formation protein HypE [Candidatus Methylomirabilis sp.]|nr:hydrogenase expression/formation protein HypE [Candidatus Methylomirabilis sp.]
MELSCPLPLTESARVLLGHGSGGRLSADLVRRFFLPRFANPYLDRLDDQAVVDVGGQRLAFTTDSFVVRPLFFPGGDIGRLAVNGTINDLAMGGARPRYLSAGFILEEGLSLDDLATILDSMRAACEEAGVLLVTGDTKVVDKGSADQCFINTAGIGVVEHSWLLSADQARPGDRVILSGTIGDHGMAVMSRREGLEFETEITSDTAPLWDLVATMLEGSSEIRCLRDPTRGGLASTLNELALASGVGIELDEARIPVRPAVYAACELLGLDPLYVANEGKLVAIISEAQAPAIVERMRHHRLGAGACVIGVVTEHHPKMVIMRTRVGGTRVVDLHSAEILPRIC